ncbi:hypothetical protein P8935_16840 [Telmatobacter sp. DSM 110680]|uniref:DUF4386 domain-containing protein n=1 Tax=Telmatobacter sp. DSM 110680 TaxID=3036704 RepID=A0AAU7DHF2_9BACT
MTSIASQTSASINVKHPGPPLSMLALLYTVLFIAGLFPVTMYGGMPYWPGPWESPAIITQFFQTQTTRVLACVFLQTGATVCLGLFTAVVVSRLQFLGVRAAGVAIALFGGFLCVFDSMAASFATWTLIRPAVASNPPILVTLNYLSYAFGGPGFSIPMGLLMAGVSVSAGLNELIPRWVMILGLFLAACGELSIFHLLSPQLLFLIPLTRFPGFIWIIAVGFALPRYRIEKSFETPRAA